MSAALCASVACALALAGLESRDVRASSVVALVWLAAAPLARATNAMRAAWLVACAAAPFQAVALVSDLRAGVPWIEVLSIAAVSSTWSCVLAASSTRAARASRGAAYLALWLVAAWLGPALELSSSSAGQSSQIAAWFNAISAPWWLLERTLEGATFEWSHGLARAAAPTALAIGLFALGGAREESAAHVA